MREKLTNDGLKRLDIAILNRGDFHAVHDNTHIDIGTAAVLTSNTDPDLRPLTLLLRNTESLNSSTATADAVYTEKVNKHRAEYQARGFEYIPFVVSHNGCMAKHTYKFFRDMAKAKAERHEERARRWYGDLDPVKWYAAMTMQTWRTQLAVRHANTHYYQTLNCMGVPYGHVHLP